ncbi:MAG: hypothetical protein R3F11_18830 [Verrucomicrobiales bacterium]
MKTKTAPEFLAVSKSQSEIGALDALPAPDRQRLRPQRTLEILNPPAETTYQMVEPFNKPAGSKVAFVIPYEKRMLRLNAPSRCSTGRRHAQRITTSLDAPIDDRNAIDVHSMSKHVSVLFSRNCGRIGFAFRYACFTIGSMVIG